MHLTIILSKNNYNCLPCSEKMSKFFSHYRKRKKNYRGSQGKIPNTVSVSVPVYFSLKLENYRILWRRKINEIIWTIQHLYNQNMFHWLQKPFSSETSKNKCHFIKFNVFWRYEILKDFNYIFTVWILLIPQIQLVLNALKDSK